MNAATPQIDLDRLSVVAAAAAVREHRYSAEALMAAVLERAQLTEPLVHAYVHLDPEAALQAARTADDQLHEGRVCGPLHGVPAGIKDLLATADMPTAAGSVSLAGHRPARDAEAVRRLRAAGAVVVGKQVTHEFGLGMNAPPTRNPWRLDSYPGGSTAGGSVSVAVGSSLAALGTDGGGSIRKPAALNGLVGLKPSAGMVSTDGLVPGPISVDHIGWVVRTVADAELLLRVCSDAGPGPVATDGDAAGLRLGCPSYFLQDLEQDIESSFGQCTERLSDLGATLVALEIPELDWAPATHQVIASAESYALHARWIEAGASGYHPASAAALRTGATYTDDDLALARSRREALTQAVKQAFAQHRLDALLTPTVPCGAVPMSEMDPVRLLPIYTRNTLPFNLTGAPALSVPTGSSASGLPIGVQVAGRLHEDATVLKVGRVIENAGLWRPPVLHVDSDADRILWANLGDG